MEATLKVGWGSEGVVHFTNPGKEAGRSNRQECWTSVKELQVGEVIPCTCGVLKLERVEGR